MSSFLLMKAFNLSTTLNLKVYGSVSNTSKPKHTILDKDSMKALQRFTQIEMKEHDHGE
jgi:hypothetical protein